MTTDEQKDPGDLPTSPGVAVVDDHGEPIGKVTDVISDAELLPQWVAVDPGPLRSQHLVPLERARRTDDGALAVAFGKDTVLHSPKLRRHILTHELEAELRTHYQLSATSS